VAVRVQEILNGIFKNEQWKFQLLSEWEIIVGNLADKMRLEKIDGDTLIIGVYQASWLQELYLLSHVLLQSINTQLKHPHVRYLRFKHASIYIKSSPVKKPVKKQTIQCAPPILSYEERRALNAIKDEELKNALHGFLARCHIQRKRL
jgi:hypothetical protein